MDIDFQWSSRNDDAEVLRTQDFIIAQTIRMARERGLLHRFLYQNYAYISQDVFAGYGAENSARLRAVSGRWDPEGVFGALLPGGFKLGEGVGWDWVVVED